MELALAHFCYTLHFSIFLKLMQFSYLNTFPFKKIFTNLFPLAFHCMLVDESLTHPHSLLLLFWFTILWEQKQKQRSKCEKCKFKYFIPLYKIILTTFKTLKSNSSKLAYMCKFWTSVHQLKNKCSANDNRIPALYISVCSIWIIILYFALIFKNWINNF